MEKIEKQKHSYCRQDLSVLCFGLVFICGLIGAIYGLGIWRGWDALSGYTHNVSMTSYQRFDPEPDDPGEAGKWYYWKLKHSDITVWTELFMWLCYSCHQLFIWILTFLAQWEKTKAQPKDRYSTSLGKYAWISLVVNVVFHILHLVQTHITYDATAQDACLTSSQSSVMMLSFFILLLEYSERGAFMGWPTARNTDKVSRTLRLNLRPVYLVRKYHGYAFAWASVYTFWFHPMENTYGHVLGFFHTWILMLQGSLMYTKLHKNRYWRFVLESWVLIHSVLVAIQTVPGDISKAMWPMFFFGFTFMLTVTWIFILPFWPRIPWWCRFIPFTVWLAVTLGSYSSLIPDPKGQNWIRLQEVIRIPLLYFCCFFGSWLILYIFLLIENKCKKAKPLSTLARGIYLFCTMIIYVLLVVVAIIIQKLQVRQGFFIQSLWITVLFCISVSVSFMLLKQIFHKLDNNPHKEPEVVLNGLSEVKTDEMINKSKDKVKATENEANKKDTNIDEDSESKPADENKI